MTTKYAAIDTISTNTGAVYGVGLSPHEAVAEADDYSGGDGEYDTIEITDAAYAEVLEHGGQPGCVVVDRRARIVRTHEEQGAAEA